MTAGDAARHRGFVHEAALYGSDDELLSVVLPFLRGGLEAGEPTLVALDERGTALVRDALGDTSGVTVLVAAEQYDRPATTIRLIRQLVGELVEAGADRARVVGAVPETALGEPWEAWARYEAVANHAYADLPLWAMCPYDTRATPAAVLEDVARTHPHIVTPRGGRADNPRFTGPVAFLAERPAPAPLGLERRAPDVELVDPPPGAARRAVATLGARAGLDPAAVAGMVTAVSEVVTNALVHGRAPARLRAWVGGGQLVVRVADRGSGPADPFAGLVPRSAAEGGLGLWIAHQSCDHISMWHGPDGFEVRLAITASPVAPA